MGDPLGTIKDGGVRRDVDEVERHSDRALGLLPDLFSAALSEIPWLAPQQEQALLTGMKQAHPLGVVGRQPLQFDELESLRELTSVYVRSALGRRERSSALKVDSDERDDSARFVHDVLEASGDSSSSLSPVRRFCA